jgi:hypothetical protein
MATKPLTADRNTLNGAAIYTWAELGAADDGTPIAIPFAANLCVQVSGTFDGATCVLEGSNNGTVWSTLHSERVSNNASVTLSFTAADLRHVLEQPVYIRPRTSGGGAASVVDVTLVVRAEYAKVSY